MRFTDRNWGALFRPYRTHDGAAECLPRATVYGSAPAVAMGLTPMADFPRSIITPDEFKPLIAEAHAQKRFPLYHQARAGVFAPGWMQGRYGLCWAYGLAAAVMGARALQGLPPRRLAPFSLAWLVRWQNAGFYPDRAIAGANERGIATADFVPEYNLDPSSYKPGWEADALRYRPLEWWDTRRDSELSMIAQCLTMLHVGTPLYVAYHNWGGSRRGHALECVGMLWDETERNNVVWLLRNSHDEPGPIEVAGTNSVPDEAFGVREISLAV